jgi:hypothetical protein
MNRLIGGKFLMKTALYKRLKNSLAFLPRFAGISIS